MGERGSSAQVAVDIRRLVLPAGGQSPPALADAIAASLTLRLCCQAPTPTMESTLAGSIAQAIADRTELASLAEKGL